MCPGKCGIVSGTCGIVPGKCGMFPRECGMLPGRSFPGSVPLSRNHSRKEFLCPQAISGRCSSPQKPFLEHVRLLRNHVQEVFLSPETSSGMWSSSQKPLRKCSTLQQQVPGNILLHSGAGGGTEYLGKLCLKRETCSRISLWEEEHFLEIVSGK